MKEVQPQLGTLSPERVMDLLNQGMKQAEIAREHGVSRQYVSQLAKRAGHASKRKMVTEVMPWEVPSQYSANYLYQYLRLHAHYMMFGEAALAESSVAKLRSFYRKLDVFNQVIDFDPSYPAVPTVSNTPGFAYVPREERDEDFIIKVRPGIKLSSRGKQVWKMPPEAPQPPR